MSFMAVLKGHKRYLYLAALMSLTLIVELYAEILGKKGYDFSWIYHAFNAFEYMLFVFFLLFSVKDSRIQKVIKYSIPIFVIGGLSISLLLYNFSGFPGLNINIEGFLLFLICTYILFNLEINSRQNILGHSEFWICTGILIFFGCTFFYNGIYTNIFNLDKATALRLFGVLNKPLNIILYSFIIIGTLCLKIRKKHISQ